MRLNARGFKDGAVFLCGFSDGWGQQLAVRKLCCPCRAYTIISFVAVSFSSG